MRDPCLLGVLKRIHDEILDLRKVLDDVKTDIDEIKQNMVIELDLDDTDTESNDTANTI